MWPYERACAESIIENGNVFARGMWPGENGPTRWPNIDHSAGRLGVGRCDWFADCRCCPFPTFHVALASAVFSGSCPSERESPFWDTLVPDGTAPGCCPTFTGRLLQAAIDFGPLLRSIDKTIMSFPSQFTTIHKYCARLDSLFSVVMPGRLQNTQP